MKYRMEKIVFCLCCLLLLWGSLGHAAEHVQLQVSPGFPLVVADKPTVVPVQVTLTGVSLESPRHRTPVNLAIVIDRSTSMSGERIERAKEAAIHAVQQLNENDIVSVVAYGSRIDVIVPATRASDRTLIIRAIQTLDVEGFTALFAGVSKGAAELRKFFDPSKVNRIVLLSDGMANVGPSSPGELGSLGRSLGKDSIAVTTIGLGLGYNEDLMVQLARNSDGNHAFVENAADLERVFAMELGDISSVVAQDINLEILCHKGVRPLRVLGPDATIYGERVLVRLNQIYRAQERDIIVEVEVPGGEIGLAKDIMDVKVVYRPSGREGSSKLKGRASLAFVDSEAKVRAAVNSKALTAYNIQLARLENERAIALRDEGRVTEAALAVANTTERLKRERDILGLHGLDEEIGYQINNAIIIRQEKGWDRERKIMLKDFFSKSQGQTY